MQIGYDILITYGAVIKKYPKGAFIFQEGTHPHFFYQILEGTVRVFASNEEGKELTQGSFEAGQSFGEPPLLVNKPYPSTAQACTPCVIVKLGKEKLLNILRDYSDIMSGFFYNFAERIYKKSCAAQIWVCQTPEEKILKFLHHNVEQETATDAKLLVPLTRQEIADFTGLRVETVIRTLLRMNKEKKIVIKDHKIYI